MKKFMKVCLTLLIGLIGLGVILYAIGVFTMGKDSMEQLVSDITKGNVHLGLGTDGDFGLGILTGEESVLNIGEASMFDSARESYQGDATVRLDGAVSCLDLKVGGCNFEIRRSADEGYLVETKGVGRLQAYIEDGTLYLVATRPAELSVGVKSSQVTLYVPENAVYEDVSFELGAGTLEFHKLQAGNVSFDVGAGSVEAEEIRAETLSVVMGAGEMELEDVTADEAKLSVSAGSISLSGKVNGDLTGECSAGSIELELHGKETDYNYEIFCAAGSIDVGKRSMSGLNKTKTIDNGAAKTIYLNCAAGSISVEF